jgi:hypothetical protein
MSSLFINRRVVASRQLRHNIHEGTVGLIVEYRASDNKLGIEWSTGYSGWHDWSDVVILQP